MTRKTRSIRLIAALLLGMTTALPVSAEDTPVKDAAAQAARDAKAMGKKVGKTAKKVGQDIGKASRKTFNTIRQEFRNDVIEGGPANSKPRKESGGRR
jgi:hypothetical protein